MAGWLWWPDPGTLGAEAEVLMGLLGSRLMLKLLGLLDLLEARPVSPVSPYSGIVV